MCSIVMPGDYEMLAAHSPPVFSHSPPSVFLSDYLRSYETPRFNRNTTQKTARVVQANNIAPTVTFTSQFDYLSSRPQPPRSLSFPPHKMPAATPRRPCLVIRPISDESSSSNDESDPSSPTRSKKKVVFADVIGQPLTHVRVMSEPSNFPPVWTSKFLSQVTKGVNPEAAPEPWELRFPQPASDYVQFRDKLNTASVSLENVIVRESEGVVVGTVKVRNIAFKKEVFVRNSSDNWETHEDAFCTYVKNNVTIPAAASVYVLYDTFSFRLTLPPKSRRLEFCVCFQCDNKEFWDSNDGKNYVIIKKEPVPIIHKSLSDEDFAKIVPNNRANETVPVIKKCRDVTQANLQIWSEFASWTHLETTTPYW